MTDFSVLDEGTVVLFTPLTKKASDFIKEFVDIPSWAWLGNGFGVDHRMAQPLMDGIKEHGFSIGEGA